MNRPRRQETEAEPQPALVIRLARSGDEESLARLAQLDGTGLASGEGTLVAEVDGELLAAVSLDRGAVIADPFQPTAALVQMLQLRRDQLRPSARRHGLRALLSHLRPSGVRPASAPATPGNAPLLVSRD